MTTKTLIKSTALGVPIVLGLALVAVFFVYNKQSEPLPLIQTAQAAGTVSVDLSQTKQTIDDIGLQLFNQATWVSWYGVKFSDAFASFKNELGIDFIAEGIRTDCMPYEDPTYGGSKTCVVPGDHTQYNPNTAVADIQAAIAAAQIEGTTPKLNAADVTNPKKKLLDVYKEAENAGLKTLWKSLFIPQWMADDSADPKKDKDYKGPFIPDSPNCPNRDCYQVLVNYWEAVLRAAHAKGVTLDYLILVNEPSNARYGGFTSGQLATLYQRVGAMVDSLIAQGIAPVGIKLIGADDDETHEEFARGAVDTYVDIRGFHTYNNGVLTAGKFTWDATALQSISSEAGAADLTALRNSTAKPLWMTEFAPNGVTDVTVDDIKTGLVYAEHLHLNFVRGVNGYLLWNQGGGGKDIFKGYANGKVNYRPAGLALAHFAKWIDPGMKRVTATENPETGVLVSAYKSASRVVVVLINKTSSTKTQTLQVSGASVGGFKSYVTTNSSSNVISESNPGSVVPGGTVSLPAYSITTLVGSIGTNQAPYSYTQSYDYNNNHAIDRTDLKQLAENYYPILSNCPVGQDCDLNNDNKLTITDVSLYQSIVLNNELFFDYDNSGSFDLADVNLIGDVYWPELSRCPVGKICDIDNDNNLDVVDVQILAGVVEIPIVNPNSLDPNATVPINPINVNTNTNANIPVNTNTNTNVPVNTNANSNVPVNTNNNTNSNTSSGLSPEEQALLDRIDQLQYRISELEQDVVELERQLTQQVDAQLTQQVEGQILLQVDQNGEAWYVDPETEKRYYLKDGETAYVALNAFGLGISDQDIATLPIGLVKDEVIVDTDKDGLDNKLEEAIGTNPTVSDTDGDKFSDGIEVQNNYNPLGSGKARIDTSLVERLKGKILLQVQKDGQAWYVNPADGKRYYLKDGETAYQIMRYLSLGITNVDIRKIEVGSF